MNPSHTISHFDAYLADRGLQFDAIVVGGAALALMGLIARHTDDCDVLDPELPLAVRAAAAEFAKARRAAGEELAEDWLNNGPSSLVAELPAGWRERLQPVFEGRAMRLQVLGRPDFLKTKLYALCDRGRDLMDCISMAPSDAELTEAEPWVAARDGHPGWSAHVHEQLSELRERIGREQS